MSEGGGGEVGVVKAGHAGEGIKLAVFAFLDDADGTFLVGKIGRAEFAGEAFSEACEAREEAAQIFV